MDFRELPPVKDQLKKCVRCGLCTTVCPIFAEIRNETVAPRGHVFMVQALKDNKVQPEKQVYDKLSNCLLCETCSTVCPSGINVPELNEAARSYIYAQNPSAIKNLVFDNFWTKPSLMRLGGRFMWAANKSGLQKASRKLGLTKLLPGDLSDAEQILQEVPRRTARSVLPEVSPSQGPKKMRVGYFLGCGTDLFSPSVALATVKVLTSWGCEVIVPRGMKCCGLPHTANGKMDTAQNLALHNLKVFNSLDLDYIVTDCASCSSALSAQRFHLLLNNMGYDEEIQKFCSRTFDLTSFLIEILELKPQNISPIQKKVTYHDPCHLSKAQGIRQAPRDLLKLIPGLELVEMSDADRCCGGSGTFSLTHYQLSMKVLGKKMDSISATRADIIATCCPSCIMQLKHGTSLYDYDATVKHPIELLATAIS